MRQIRILDGVPSEMIVQTTEELGGVLVGDGASCAQSIVAEDVAHLPQRGFGGRRREDADPLGGAWSKRSLRNSKCAAA